MGSSAGRRFIPHAKLVALQASHARGDDPAKAARDADVCHATAWRYFRRFEAGETPETISAEVAHFNDGTLAKRFRQAFAIEAQRRGIGVDVLVNAVLEMIARDDLFEAVLGDSLETGYCHDTAKFGPRRGDMLDVIVKRYGKEVASFDASGRLVTSTLAEPEPEVKEDVQRALRRALENAEDAWGTRDERTRRR